MNIRKFNQFLLLLSLFVPLLSYGFSDWQEQDESYDQARILTQSTESVQVSLNQCQNTCDWTRLPKDMLGEIFKNFNDLSDAPILACISRVCKIWHQTVKLRLSDIHDIYLEEYSEPTNLNNMYIVKLMGYCVVQPIEFCQTDRFRMASSSRKTATNDELRVCRMNYKDWLWYKFQKKLNKKLSDISRECMDNLFNSI